MDSHKKNNPGYMLSEEEMINVLGGENNENITTEPTKPTTKLNKCDKCDKCDKCGFFCW